MIIYHSVCMLSAVSAQVQVHHSTVLFSPLLPSPLLAADAGTAEGRGPSTGLRGTAYLCGKRKRRKEETSLNGEDIWIDTTTARL